MAYTAFDRFVAWCRFHAAQPHIRQGARSEEHTSELQSLAYLVCRLLLEKKKKKKIRTIVCINEIETSFPSHMSLAATLAYQLVATTTTVEARQLTILSFRITVCPPPDVA